MIRKLKKRATEGAFTRNVFTLMAGTVVGQAIPILISPIIGRMYSPDDFATFGLFLSISSILGVVAAGRYEMAVMLPRKDEDAMNLVRLCVLLIVGFCSVCLIPLLLFSGKLASLLKNPSLASWMGLTALAALSFSLFQTFTMWLNRKNRYRSISWSKVIQAAVSSAAMIGFGLMIQGPAGLIWAYLLSLTIPAVWLGLAVLRARKEGQYRLSRGKMIEQAGRYGDFPKINAAHAFIDQLQSNGVIFIISALFSSSVLGLYTFTMRVLRTPLIFIGKAVSQVFYQKAAETYNAGKDIHGLVKKIILQLALIGLPIFAFLALTAPFLFSLIFGEKWRTAGVYTQILSPWLYFNFISSSLSQLPLLVNEQKMNFIIGFFYYILLVGCLLAGYWMHDVRIGFMLVSGFMSIYIILTLAWYLRISRKKGTDHQPIESLSQFSE